MNTVNTSEARQQRITFRKPPGADVRDTLCAELLAIDGVQKVEFKQGQLQLDYSFPATTFAELWQLLCSRVDGESMAGLARWRAALAAFREDNERAYLHGDEHWETYVRDIHVYYADLEANELAAGHKHLWRRHQLKGKPGTQAVEK